MTTLFLEVSGAHALAVLSGLAERLKANPACQAQRLLKSTEQEELFLLVLEWQSQELPELPEGVKVWKFKALRTNEREF